MAKEKEKKVRQKINWKKEMKLAPGYIVIILWVIFTFMLLGWILAASLSTTTDIFAGKALKFPTGLHFENYVQAWGSGGVATFFMNSMLYSLVSCFLLILICAPAAYVLARFTFLGNKIIQTSFVSAMGIPITMIVLPLFSVVANLGILNSVFASKVTLIFLYIGINIPYTTIFLLTFFSNLSRTYEEAAAIDGCPPTKTFWKIMFPMAQSGIVTVTIFNFINIWNEYVSYRVIKDGIELSSGTVIFSYPKYFKYENPKLEYTVSENKIIIRADSYAKSVYITNADDTLVLTDNYFDMNGGEKIVEIIEGNTEDLRIRSVYDIR